MGFLLTGGFLGMLCYFLPKQAEQPIWSYRLSVVAFWAFTYSYIWAGPHHLHYSAIPEWVQSLGMVMSLILLAPSWATMINGIMTGMKPYYALRLIAGLTFLGGTVLMAYNLYMTTRSLHALQCLPAPVPEAWGLLVRPAGASA